MADQKITELTQGTPLNTDVVPYVDLVTGTTKKALKSELKGDTGDTGATGAAGADAVVKSTSTTSLAIGTGSKAFVTATAMTVGVGAYILAAETAAPETNWMFGQVTSISGVNITINSTVTAGSGTIAAWTLTVAGIRGATGAQGPQGEPGTIGGTTGATDSAIILADGVGGSTIKTSSKTIVTSLGTDDTTVPTSKAVKDVTDAKLALTGGTMSGSITLGENTSIALDPAGSADGKYTGITITATAGYTQAFGDLVYLAVADSRWELADADALATAGTVMLAMVVVAGTDGNPCTLLLQGQIRADAKFPALTVGAPVYVGETAGAIQTTIPTGADNVIRVVGFALTADEIYFNPSQDHQTTVA